MMLLREIYSETYNNIGLSFEEKKEFVKALNYYKKQAKYKQYKRKNPKKDIIVIYQGSKKYVFTISFN